MPNGQYPVIAAGQVITASLLASMIDLVAYKASDTSRASNTVLAADPDLSLSVASAGTWVLNGYLNYEGGTGGSSDLEMKFSSVGTLRYHMAYEGSGGSSNVGNTNVGGQSIGCRTQGATVLCGLTIRGSIVTASAGSITLDWAQGTSSGTPTIVHAGSWIAIRRIA